MSKGHSEDYFSSYRDHWWNVDFIELMARRLSLSACSSLLDVGCGQCHWSRLWLPHLHSMVQVHAVDADPKWAAGSPELQAYFADRGASIVFRQASVYALPYADDSFDVVSCQTLLIHVADPLSALREMKRVAKPGGLILCAEPNNVATTLVKSTSSADDPIAEILTNVEDALVLERGKALAGQGDNSFGDLLPAAFSAAGLTKISTYLSDKCEALFPPYDSAHQRALLANLKDWAMNEEGPYDWAEVLRYLDVQGDEMSARLLGIRRRSAQDAQRFEAAIAAQTFATAGGSLMYLVSGRK